MDGVHNNDVSLTAMKISHDDVNSKPYGRSTSQLIEGPYVR